MHRKISWNYIIHKLCSNDFLFDFNELKSLKLLQNMARFPYTFWSNRKSLLQRAIISTKITKLHFNFLCQNVTWYNLARKIDVRKSIPCSESLWKMVVSETLRAFGCIHLSDDPKFWVNSFTWDCKNEEIYEVGIRFCEFISNCSHESLYIKQ